MLKLLVYTSVFVSPVEGWSEDLADIATKAHQNNAKHNITGFLLFHRGRCVQILEGFPEDIDVIYNRISQDSRHGQIQILIETTLSQRTCINWNMRVIDLTDGFSILQEPMQRVISVYSSSMKPQGADLINILLQLIKQIDESDTHL